jgi:hypothetical protein
MFLCVLMALLTVARLARTIWILLGRRRLRGRLIPPTRIFAPECVRAIVEAIVDANAERRGTP